MRGEVISAVPITVRPANVMTGLRYRTRACGYLFWYLFDLRHNKRLRLLAEVSVFIGRRGELRTSDPHNPMQSPASPRSLTQEKNGPGYSHALICFRQLLNKLRLHPAASSRPAPRLVVVFHCSGWQLSRGTSLKFGAEYAATAGGTIKSF